MKCLVLVFLAFSCGKPAPGPEGASTLPVKTLPNLTTTGGASAIFAGGGRTCAVLGHKDIRCWGEASRGSLGPNVTSSSMIVPTAMAGIDGAVKIVFGDQHGCARMPDGTVRCWGSNFDASLGNKRATSDSATPLVVPGLAGVTAIAAGGERNCAITGGGAVSCWGSDFGDAPTAIPNVTGAVQLAVGDHHACARTHAGGVTCWGANDHQQLGSLAGLAHVDEIAAGGDATCARIGGAVRCWGGGFDALLGDPARADSARPLTIAGLDDAKAIAMGKDHACALRAGGTVSCWGGPDYGAFGVPAGCPKDHLGERRGDNGREVMITDYCAAPVAVGGLAGVTAIVHGNAHACALLQDGGIRCWGGTSSGELGNRDHGADGSRTPIAVTFPPPRAPSGTRASAVSISGHWSCALITDGTVRCWGANPFREMPDTGQAVGKPVAIPDLTGVKQLAIGSYHGCVVLDAGAVRCWGYDGEGELGNGKIDGVTHVGAVTPVGLPPVTSIVAAESQSESNTCALTGAGEVWCWGVNQSSPKQIAGVKGATSIATSSSQSCALVGGVVSCWTPAAGAAKPVPGFDHVAEVAAGATVLCARRDDGSLWCANTSTGAPGKLVETKGPLRTVVAAGWRGLGVRKDGTVFTFWLESPDTLTEISSLKDPASVAAAADDFCALDHDGRVLCWGMNSMGQLGNPDQGTDGVTEVPAPVSL